MIKAVLFDLDGTLLNRDASVRQFIENQYDRYLHQLNLIPRQDYIKRFIELDQRGYVWKDNVYQQLVQEYSIEISWEVLLQDYIAHFQSNCVPFANMHKMLDDLKQRNLRLAIITNGFGQFQMDNIDALGIAHYFDGIFVSEWEQMKKPQPEIFYKALKQLSVLPEESIYVGDHPVNDIEGAQRVGMKTIWKRDPYFGSAATPYKIDDLEEITDIVDTVNESQSSLL